MQRKIITVLFKAIDRAMNMGMKVYMYIICVLNVYFETQNLQYNVYYSVNDVAYTFCDTKLHGNYHSVRDVITHTEEKPIKCNICDQCQWNSNKQDKHLEIHTGEKPCQCNICDINLITTKSDLEYKQRTHTREKPYQCSVCDRDHTGERSYQCVICDVHDSAYTREIPCQCSICDTWFISNNKGMYQILHIGRNLKYRYRVIYPTVKIYINVLSMKCYARRNLNTTNITKCNHVGCLKLGKNIFYGRSKQ